jgi:hypothetical protein
MPLPTPEGITPPAPGLDHEEPELLTEEDIPATDDGRAWATAEIEKIGQ